jgi:hypothetical protein
MSTSSIRRSHKYVYNYFLDVQMTALDSTLAVIFRRVYVVTLCIVTALFFSGLTSSDVRSCWSTPPATRLPVPTLWNPGVTAPLLLLQYSQFPLYGSQELLLHSSCYKKPGSAAPLLLLQDSQFPLYGSQDLLLHGIIGRNTPGNGYVFVTAETAE